MGPLRQLRPAPYFRCVERRLVQRRQLTPIQKVQLDHSDVISFHNYEEPGRFEKAIQSLQRYKRPILCTEYMARGNNSTFEGSLPVAKKYNVAANNWGLVQGRRKRFFRGIHGKTLRQSRATDLVP